MVDIVQLARAPGCGPGGRGFESHYPPHFQLGCSQVGKARDFESWCPGFDSPVAHHKTKYIIYAGVAELADALDLGSST